MQLRISDILSVSSGTMASLSGYHQYAQVDAMTSAWLAFEVDSPTENDGSGLPVWMQSWNRFKSSFAYLAATTKCDLLLNAGVK